MSFLSKLEILIESLCGEGIKLYYSICGELLNYGINTSEERKNKVTVSLTSYGRRVASVLPFTIMSLLRQRYKPDRIVLWLDGDNWNDEKIPSTLKRLKEYGLTIKYCKDLKSYKKLIPTLEEYPDDIIITCDDDIYYRNDMIANLIQHYYNSPDKVYANIAHRVKSDSNGRILSYDEWDFDITGDVGSLIFPVGCGGILYRKDLLYKDVTNQNLFMELAPSADDIWFFFMEKLKGTICEVIPSGKRFIPLDNLYQYFHKNANLSSSNVKENLNDIQIKSVMEHYNLTNNLNLFDIKII